MFTDPKVGMMSATIWPSTIRGRAATGGRHGAGHPLESLLYHAHGLLHLRHAHQVAIEVVAVLAQGYLELDPVIGPVRLHPSQVEGDSRRAQQRPRDTPGDGLLGRERPHADHAVHEDAVARDEGVDF